MTKILHFEQARYEKLRCRKQTCGRCGNKMETEGIIQRKDGQVWMICACSEKTCKNIERIFQGLTQNTLLAKNTRTLARSHPEGILTIDPWRMKVSVPEADGE